MCCFTDYPTLYINSTPLFLSLSNSPISLSLSLSLVCSLPQMSQYFIESPKHCAKKELNLGKFRYKKLFYFLSAFVFPFLSFILLIWLILRPSKPDFSLKETNVYQLNLSSGSHLLNSSIQLSLFAKNPNKKVGIYYDELQVYAAYKGQQITTYTSLPPFYQDHEDSNLLSASLVGTGLPVAQSFGYEVGRDQTAGRLVLNLKVIGKLRWKVGTWVSGKYRFNVNCVAIMAFGPAIPTGPLTSKQGTLCSTTI